MTTGLSLEPETLTPERKHLGMHPQPAPLFSPHVSLWQAKRSTPKNVFYIVNVLKRDKRTIIFCDTDNGMKSKFQVSLRKFIGTQPRPLTRVVVTLTEALLSVKLKILIVRLH